MPLYRKCLVCLKVDGKVSGIPICSKVCSAVLHFPCSKCNKKYTYDVVSRVSFFQSNVDKFVCDTCVKTTEPSVRTCSICDYEFFSHADVGKCTSHSLYTREDYVQEHTIGMIHGKPVQPPIKTPVIDNTRVIDVTYSLTFNDHEYLDHQVLPLALAITDDMMDEWGNIIMKDLDYRAPHSVIRRKVMSMYDRDGAEDVPDRGRYEEVAHVKIKIVSAKIMPNLFPSDYKYH